ncbi:hypothetical protein ACFVT9_26225 [Kitasatospora cineracea]|uniref:hypothetical protein n=1 Tax=Kitasatospora cineracea TaxID=88074 RepID=UPI0036D9E88B
MNTRHRVQLFLAVLLSGLAPILLGRQFDWPVWACVFGSAVLVGLVGLLMTTRTPRSEAPEASDLRSAPQWAAEPEPPTELPFREVSLRNVPLPSALPDYDFRLSATVLWRPTRPLSSTVHADPAGLATEAILVRARQVSMNEHPGRPELLALRLTGLLGGLEYDGGGSLSAMANRITVDLADGDGERLEKMAALRKAEEVWEQQRQYERSRREYLGGDVLKTPGSAVVWWLARHEEDVEQAVQLIGPLAVLAAAANDSEVPEVFRRYVDHLPGGGEDPLTDPELDAELADLLTQEHRTSGDTGGDDGFAARMADLMSDLGVSPDSEEGQVWLHRVERAKGAVRTDPTVAQSAPDDLDDPGEAPDRYDQEPPRPGTSWQDFQDD